jgi:hypothetical protein
VVPGSGIATTTVRNLDEALALLRLQFAAG